MTQIYNLPKVQGKYRFNVDLSKTNWFRVGGKADIVFIPEDMDDLVNFLTKKPDDLKINILGVGSNIIIRDGGVEGVVIKLGNGFSKISHHDEILQVGASCLCYNVALYSRLNALTNLEFLAGIPGSIGGSIAMNAGCYNSEIGDFLISAIAVDKNGAIHQLQNADFNFNYRHNPLKNDFFFLEGKFKVKKSSSEEVGKKIAEFNRKREETQPIRQKTSGSTFKNPKGDKKAWQLIDEAGCRGLKIGDAMMSEKHCNFMINIGNSSSKDLISLGEEVIKRVFEKSGIILEWEIKIIGRD